MAKYEIKDAVIKTVEAGKQNAGKKFLVAQLQNTLCIWEETQTFTCFIDIIVNAYAQLLPISKGGLAQAEQPIPEQLKYVTGCWIDWEPAQQFYKQHLSNHEARPATATSAARPAIRAGELVKKGDTPIVYTKLRIFCVYYIDEFNEKQFVRGGSPEEVGQRAFTAYCVPITPERIATPAPAQVGIETVGGQPIQTAPAPQGNTNPQYNPQQPPQFTGAPQGGAAQFG